MVKVGEKFEYIGEKTNRYTHGKVYAVTQETYRDGSHCMADDVCNQHWWDEESMKGIFKPYTPTQGPIREVRRREIVPGQWGNINVNCVVDGNVFINVRDDFGHVPFNAEQLREAAHLFNQLAEVLEEQG